MKTADNLKTLTLKDLAQMAKKRGVHGWHAMRKDQLVKILSNLRDKQAAAKHISKSNGKRNGAPQAATNGRSGSNGRHAAAATRRSVAPRPKSPHVIRRLKQVKARIDRSKNLANGSAGRSYTKDRLIVMVRDPFWLHAYWELTRHGVQRAEAALGQEWHVARPVLRLLDVSSHGTTSTSEELIKYIDVHGGVNNWYIDVQDPPRTYRVDIGYLTASGKFFMLARSNVVSTPRPGASDSIDNNWSDVAENFNKIYAMSGGCSPEGPSVELQELFEERLRRPMGSPLTTRFGAGADAILTQRDREFSFEIDAELIVYGVTEPDAHVTLQGEPVQLRSDGTFTVRYSMPNCRQVIPAVASSRDGVEQRTVVLAVERNTKVMEPVTRDSND